MFNLMFSNFLCCIIFFSGIHAAFLLENISTKEDNFYQRQKRGKYNHHERRFSLDFDSSSSAAWKGYSGAKDFSTLAKRICNYSELPVAYSAALCKVCLQKVEEEKENFHCAGWQAQIKINMHWNEMIKIRTAAERMNSCGLLCGLLVFPPWTLCHKMSAVVWMHFVWWESPLSDGKLFPAKNIICEMFSIFACYMHLNAVHEFSLSNYRRFKS